MILVKPSFEVLSLMIPYWRDEFASNSQGIISNPLQLIELAGRTCYKSEDKITEGSTKKFVENILKRGHESVIEHSAMTVKIICDRGVTHEIVRHRLCAFSQESTRYCNYKGGVTFVIPPWVDIEPGTYHVSDDLGKTQGDYDWANAMITAEYDYISLLANEWSPQQARSVLPNSTKTEIVITANFREWRHIFKLRCSKAAHPQMSEIMIPLHRKAKELVPIIFDDIEY
jgi:thymidylate synthase (FAD)